jgi:hypothetical protein
MKLKFSLFLAIAASVVTALTIAPTASSARPATGGLAVPITGLTCTLEGTTTAAPCTLTATLTGFTAQNGQLLAQVSATLTNLTTGATQTVSLLLPVTVNDASCTILDLTIQPIHLDLLGLVVDTDTIHLEITAQQGPGNLLGNLLCGIAGLLDQGVPLNQLANTLNQLLRLLG